MYALKLHATRIYWDSCVVKFWTNDRRLERAAAGRIAVVSLADAS